MEEIKGKKFSRNNKYYKNYEIEEDNIYIFKENSSNQKVKPKINVYLILLFLIITFIPSLAYKLLFYKNTNLKKYFVPNTHRLAFVFGTRPEAVKLFPLIKELKENKKFICIIINTGQHKEMIQQVFDSLNMDNEIDFNLNLMQKNQSLSKLTAKIILELEDIYSLINPNAVIVQGDTTTGFAAAVSAFYQKIPIFHVEAGLRTNNKYYPFPEEFNRVTIDDLSNLYFAPTEWAASNLLKENKNSNNIFITGNTIVDSLQLTLNNTSPSKEMKNLIEKAKLLCNSNKCKIILLTCHRRENYFKPIYNILNSVQELLKNNNDIVIIFPFHLNPNVRKSIENAIPKEAYDDIIKGKKIEKKEYLHLNRLLIIPPLNYIDLIHLESISYFIMSDSGGIQEEAVSIGKPLIILRETTDRPESVKAGCSFLAGNSYDKIYNYVSSLLTNIELYKNMSKLQYIYGKGDSRIIISQIIQNYFNNITQNSISFNNQNYRDILSQYDNNNDSINNNNIINNDSININNNITNNDSININNNQNEIDFYDIVIVLTVWKRNNLESQLFHVKSQSILKNKKTNIIIFQNSNHVNIEDIVNKWKQSDAFDDDVVITFIQSPIETGYFGRFIAPLTSNVRSDSYFIICDDDIIWGKRYFENMIRVVNEGSLCTRNGRIITENYETISEVYKNGGFNKHVCYNEDIEYDFGGHTWAGRISWLRNAWNHIPFSFENSEDFWLSATLKCFYNITTKIPKCPCPEGNEPVIPDMCAVTHKTSDHHENAQIGNSTISKSIRAVLMKEITEKFGFQRLIESKPEYVKNLHKKFMYGYRFFKLDEAYWKDALYWQ